MTNFERAGARKRAAFLGAALSLTVAACGASSESAATSDQPAARPGQPIAEFASRDSQKGFRLLYSMTGFGNAARSTDVASVSVELKAVNNRYLKISMRLPEIVARFETAAVVRRRPKYL